MATRLAVKHTRAAVNLLGGIATKKPDAIAKPHKVAVKRSKKAQFKKINRA